MMPPMLSQIRQNGLPSWAYKAALLLAAAIWGMGTVVIKSTVDEFPPAWIVGVRFTLAGIILGIATAPRISRAFARNKRGHLRDGAGWASFCSSPTGSTPRDSRTPPPPTARFSPRSTA